MSGKKIKILGVETHYQTPDGTERLSAVDWYRVVNPLQTIAKYNDDIEVDFVKKIVKESGEEAYSYMKIGQEYDIIWTSYIDTPKAYSWIKAVCDQYNMAHVMDIDDNIFEIDVMNPASLKYQPGSEMLQNATIIISDVEHLVTSTDHLAKVCAPYREGNKPVVLPNYINTEAYNYDESKVPDNSPDIYIGYQGSSTHYSDFMNTNIMWALKRLIKEYDNVKFYTIGMAFDDMRRFFPEDKFVLGQGERDHRKWRKTWQELPIDIGLAPLIDTSFNKAKSSIKYYEYALRKIPAVYSWVDTYLSVVREGETGYFAKTETEWYEKIKILIDDEVKRKAMGEAARKDVLDNYTIDTNYKPVEDFIRRIHGEK